MVREKKGGKDERKEKKEADLSTKAAATHDLINWMVRMVTENRKRTGFGTSKPIFNIIYLPGCS